MQAMGLIRGFLQEQRRSLLDRGLAFTRHAGGEVRDNFFGTHAEADGLRHSRSERGHIPFTKPLRPDFRLIVKHPAVFTGLLPELAQAFPCYALIRNPLAVLASWNSNNIAVRDGRAPAAEGVDPVLHAELNRIGSRDARQIHLLGWFFRRFHSSLPASHVIRYEDLITSGGRALQVITPGASALDEALESRNESPLYALERQEDLVARLLDSEGAYWRYYRREEIRAMSARAASDVAERPIRPARDFP